MADWQKLKKPKSFCGPRVAQCQVTESGVDRKANTLDQGTPALQFNLGALQLIGNSAAEGNQAHDSLRILNTFVFEGCIDRCIGSLQNIGGCFGGCIKAKPFFNRQLREALLSKGGHIGHKG